MSIFTHYNNGPLSLNTQDEAQSGIAPVLPSPTATTPSSISFYSITRSAAQTPNLQMDELESLEQEKMHLEKEKIQHLSAYGYSLLLKNRADSEGFLYDPREVSLRARSFAQIQATQSKIDSIQNRINAINNAALT